MTMAYVMAPFLGYVVAGGLKFLLNSIKLKQWAFKAMGLGGFPSTHNTVTSTVATLIALKEGFSSSALSVALGLLVIVLIDSLSLRKAIEAQAKVLLKLSPTDKLRARIGHTPLEAFGGLCLGVVCGFLLSLVDF